jgi:hypothetical protein
MTTAIALRAVAFRFGLLLALLQGGNAALSVGTASAQQGAVDVRIPVGLASFDAEVVGLRFVFNYDAEQMALKGVEIGESALEANKALTFESEFPGRLQVVIQGLDRDVILDGEIAVLRFDVSPAATLAPVGLVTTEGTAFGVNATVIPLELNPGLFMIGDIELAEWLPAEVIALLNRDPGTARFFLLIGAVSGVLLLLGVLLNLTDRKR